MKQVLVGRGVMIGAILLGIAACGSDSGGAPAVSTGNGGGVPAATVLVQTLSGHGQVLVAGMNGMTLYQFDQDVAGSGKSACTGGCISTWPPLTVGDGVMPSAGAGVTGQLGIIQRPDGKGTQVTYNGLPLHFFSGDTKPGEANGNYPHWSVVAVSSPGTSSSPTPVSTGSNNPSAGY